MFTGSASYLSFSALARTFHEITRNCTNELFLVRVFSRIVFTWRAIIFKIGHHADRPTFLILVLQLRIMFMSILIAEDNVAQRAYLREILERDFTSHQPVLEA
jgi:hypothetical protein